MSPATAAGPGAILLLLLAGVGCAAVARVARAELWPRLRRIWRNERAWRGSAPDDAPLGHLPPTWPDRSRRRPR